MHSYHLLKCLLLGGFFGCYAPFLSAQPVVNGEKARVSAENLDNLVQGRLYTPNYFPVQGSPFLTKDWSLEDLHIQGQPYQEIPVWYDIYIDDLIMLYQEGAKLHFIRLNREHVEYFSLGDRNFINLVYSEYRHLKLQAGFYEVAFKDKLTFLVKRSLEVKEENNSLESYFSRNDRRYIIIKDIPYRVNNRRSILEAIGKTHKKALKTFVRSRSISIKNATDDEWLALIHFLNTLQPDQQ